MTRSASTVNRRQTAERIIHCAQNLAEQHGLDGFTMEDVAECAGVSRRTLFNHVSGKLDAVLGAPPSPDPSRLDEFRAGGPTGRLVEDIKIVIGAVLDSKAITAEQWERRWRLIRSDARLHRELHDEFTVIAGFFREAILEREGDRFDPPRAHAAAMVTLSMFDVALDAFVADPNTSLADHYLTAIDGAAALFA